MWKCSQVSFCLQLERAIRKMWQVEATSSHWWSRQFKLRASLAQTDLWFYEHAIVAQQQTSHSSDSKPVWWRKPSSLAVASTRTDRQCKPASFWCEPTSPMCKPIHSWHQWKSMQCPPSLGEKPRSEGFCQACWCALTDKAIHLCQYESARSFIPVMCSFIPV